MDNNDLNNRFSYHPPSGPEIVNLYGEIRGKALDFAHYLNEVVPEGREKSLAITHLEDMVMWANAGIARKDTA